MMNGDIMQLSVYSRSSKIKVSEIKDAAQFYAGLLMHRNLIKNLDIMISFDDNGLDGSCSIEDDFARPREFLIQLNPKRSVEKILCALAHEMVHVKQYATGESRNYERQPSFVRFRGVMVNTKTTLYWDQPWEIEAFGREYGLYVRYMEDKHAKAKAAKKKPGR
jgi:hypothetical protein